MERSFIFMDKKPFAKRYQGIYQKIGDEYEDRNKE
jgi:hypothetical protein